MILILWFLFKEVLIIRFSPANDEEKIGYKEYFKYLSEKKRFGVVGNGASVIKDMYILPLPSQESLPSALKPYRHKGKFAVCLTRTLTLQYVTLTAPVYYYLTQSFNPRVVMALAPCTLVSMCKVGIRSIPSNL